MGDDSAEARKTDADFTERVVGDSKFVQAVRGVGSELNEHVDRIADYVEHSRLYGWLTKEPEPNVIVIDLRETYTIGPVIRLLDEIIERVRPYWEASTLKRVMESMVSVAERASRTRVGRAVVAVLEPPEPTEGARAGEEGTTKREASSGEEAGIDENGST